MKTYVAKPSQVQSRWFLIDVNQLEDCERVLGRLASRIAHFLRGKCRPDFTPHVDMGEHVVVVNAELIALTAKKSLKKLYYRHSGKEGCLKKIPFMKMHAQCPERILFLAVKGMLSRGPLGYRLLKKLRIYKGPQHLHTAQVAEPMHDWHVRVQKEIA